MTSVYYTLQDFITHTELVIYLLMAGALVALPLFWRFLSGRDVKKRTY